MPTKSSSSKTTSSKTTKKPAARKATKKSVSTATPAVAKRHRFLGLAVLLAAGLIAAAGAFATHESTSSNNNVVAAADGAIMYIGSEAGANTEAGATLTVKVYENSGENPINAVQSAILYPADKLQLVAVKQSTDFPKEAATDTSTAGLVRIARSINAEDAPVTGAREVATLEFKVSANASKNIVLQVDKSTSLVVRSTDNQNVLSQTPTSTFKIE